MSPSADEKAGQHPLEPVLRDIEAELRDRLRDACEAEANGVSSESAAEIRRLEDSLLAAAVAAEQTIALRRHIEQGKAEAARQPDRPTVSHDAAEPVLKLREFRDAEGRLWRAWPVTPGQARPGRTAQRYLGEFHNGWICFEALESSARRRLPRHPERWAELKEPELCQLLDQAVSAPQRKRQRQATDEPPRAPVH